MPVKPAHDAALPQAGYAFGATWASGWLLRLSASAQKPDAFISSTKPAQIFVRARRGPSACPSPAGSP